MGPGMGASGICACWGTRATRAQSGSLSGLRDPAASRLGLWGALGERIASGERTACLRAGAARNVRGTEGREGEEASGECRGDLGRKVVGRGRSRTGAAGEMGSHRCDGLKRSRCRRAATAHSLTQVRQVRQSGRSGRWQAPVQASPRPPSELPIRRQTSCTSHQPKQQGHSHRRCRCRYMRVRSEYGVHACMGDACVRVCVHVRACVRA